MLTKAQAVRWDLLKEGDGANDYMQLLVKETVTLHKVLSRYLSISVVEVSLFHTMYTVLNAESIVVCHDTSLRSYQPPALGRIYAD